MIKTYVLSLISSTERRKTISEELAALGLKFEFFPAINVSAYSCVDSIDESVLNAMKHILGRQLTLPELGCVLSHQAVYRLIINQGVEVALILEDDAVLSEETPDLLSALYEFPAFDIALLGHRSLYRDSVLSGAESSLLWQRKICGRALAKPAEFALGAFAYVIRKSGAEKLLEFFPRPTIPADYMTGGAERAQCDLRIISPPVAIHRAGPSTIGDRGISKLTDGKSGFSEGAKRIVRSLLLCARKIGFLRKSYVWAFNRNFPKL